MAQDYILDTLQAEKRARTMNRIGRFLTKGPRTYRGSSQFSAEITRLLARNEMVGEEVADKFAQVAALAIEAIEQWSI